MFGGEMFNGRYPYESKKRYGHETGFSVAFRQWKAQSHCRFIHGYALAFTFRFEANELDERGWVVDFGSLKSLKGMLEDHFDHKTVIAEDDPHLDYFKEGHKLGVLDLRIIPAGGCERFAEYVYNLADIWLLDNGYAPRVRVREVEVEEHPGNGAKYSGKD